MAQLKVPKVVQRRREIINTLWPDAEKRVWHRSVETGFCTVPRTLGLIAVLLRHLGDKRDPSRVYLDLWTRQFDDSFVEVRDVEEMAMSAGYANPPRNVRSWREAVDELQRWGFIDVKPKAARKHGYILLLHPHDVVQMILQIAPKEVPPWWPPLFHERINEVRATLRNPGEVVEPLGA